MSTPDTHVWDEWAENSRGLLARPILPNNLTALRSHIASIEASIYNLTDGGAPTVVPLVVNDVMLTAPSGKGTWGKDDVGYTFNWPADGSLWPLPNKQYLILVKFVCNNSLPVLENKVFYRRWRNTTYPLDS